MKKERQTPFWIFFVSWSGLHVNVVLRERERETSRPRERNEEVWTVCSRGLKAASSRDGHRALDMAAIVSTPTTTGKKLSEVCCAALAGFNFRRHTW